ncbi:MMPL family transporter [Acanthopleuribacter pedis]|uniref:MMPL family transporter n=1 Tax=Acanthopleuribacter pedis TaxID=442870 RepID=A0A8J7QRL6_9BACT|nr:MMPL family transporter [Acanthopleuribacter pedis]MBO1322958.1 MMPL family transporter [Acanthopleuribacter pedis]
MKNGFLPRQLPLKLVRFAASHPVGVLVSAALLLIGAAFLATRVRIAADILALIPEDNPSVDEFRTTMERFGSIDILLVGLKLNPDRDLEADTTYADILAEEMRASENINWVEYRLQDFTEAADELLDRVTLFLPPEQVPAFAAKFGEEGVDQAAAQLAERVRSPFSLGVKELIRKDPLGILPLLIGDFVQGDLGSRFDTDSGYIIDREGRYLMMFVKPNGVAANLPFDRRLMADLAEIEQRVNETWAEDEWEGAPPEVIYAGGYPAALEDSQLITRDMGIGALVALALVVTLFTLAFARLNAILISLAPLVTGLVLTFAFVALFLGRLNAATSAFAALLIGLGIDFIIVLYSRYLEERRAGGDHDQAITAMGRHTAVGVLLGAVTTAATFYAFLISGFKGLAELGLLTGTGILIVVVTVFLILPALLTLLERNRDESRFRLHAFGAEQLCVWSHRYARPVLWVSALVTLVLGAFTVNLRYDDDLMNMRATDSRSAANMRTLMNAFGTRFVPLMLRVDGATEEEALTRARGLMSELNRLVAEGDLAKIDSPVAFLPSRSQQMETLAALKTVNIDETAFLQRFDAALDRQGLNAAPFHEALTPLLASLKVTEPLSFTTLADTKVGRILERYIQTEEGVTSVLIYAYPPPDRWRRQTPPGLQALADRHPSVILTGPVVISRELKQVVWEDAWLAALLGMVLVFIFLAVDLGGFLRAVFSLVPLGVGMVWMVGLMAAFDLPVNVMNIFVFTMVIGIGVDYGVHLIHRWHESNGDVEALDGTAKAIVIAALTTVSGFGSLILSHYQGLRSMGAVAIIGALCTAVVSITLLPALLVLFQVDPQADENEPEHEG